MLQHHSAPLESPDVHRGVRITQTHTELRDKAGHIPARWNLIICIFTCFLSTGDDRIPWNPSDHFMLPGEKLHTLFHILQPAGKQFRGRSCTKCLGWQLERHISQDMMRWRHKINFKHHTARKKYYSFIYYDNACTKWSFTTDLPLCVFKNHHITMVYY